MIMPVSYYDNAIFRTAIHDDTIFVPFHQAPQLGRRVL